MTQTDFTGRSIGGYRILRKLGQGGMAVVYKAHEESLNRTVALKVIAQHLADDEQFITRFQREAQAAAQLNHPNIVQIYAIGEDDGVHYFSMEFVKGESLAEIIESDGFLTAGRALPIMRQAAEALAVAHDAGIVHRDIKPANIMVDGSTRVKVADFGIAQMASATRMTQSGMLVGTPEFISPEQCRGEKLDGRSDIYSLGVTLYQLLSGKTPFNAETPAALVYQIVEADLPPVGELNPTISDDVQQLVAKMMHRDPKQRFQSAEDLVHTLKGADTQPVTSGTRQHPAPDIIVAHSEPTVAMPASDGAPAEPTVVTPPPAAAEPATTEAMPAGEETRVEPPPTVAEPTTAAATAAPTVGAERPADSPKASPATQAYEGAGSNRGALLGMAAMVLILITVLIVAWQFMGDSSADEPFDPTAEARPAESPGANESGDANSGAEDGASASEGGADPATGDNEGPANDASSGGAPPATSTPAATDNPGAAGGSTEDPTGAEATSGGSVATGTEATGGGTVPVGATPASSGNAVAEQPAPQAGAGEPAQPEFIAPPINSVVTDTSGEYEYVEQIHAWIEREFADQQFEVIDFASSPYPDLQSAARFQVATTARLVGTETLQYFGNARTQFTVSIISRVIDLSTGRPVVGPETETIKYTALNMDQNLERGIETMARRMAQALRRQIQVP